MTSDRELIRELALAVIDATSGEEAQAGHRASVVLDACQEPAQVDQVGDAGQPNVRDEQRQAGIPRSDGEGQHHDGTHARGQPVSAGENSANTADGPASPPIAPEKCRCVVGGQCNGRCIECSGTGQKKPETTKPWCKTCCDDPYACDCGANEPQPEAKDPERVTVLDRETVATERRLVGNSEYVRNLCDSHEELRRQRDEARNVAEQHADMCARLCAKMQTERDEARRQLAATQRELERWRHGQQIEGDYVCPDSLQLAEARQLVTAQDSMLKHADALERQLKLDASAERLAHAGTKDRLAEAKRLLGLAINGECVGRLSPTRSIGDDIRAFLAGKPETEKCFTCRGTGCQYDAAGDCDELCCPDCSGTGKVKAPKPVAGQCMKCGNCPTGCDWCNE